ncbi:MAG: hypothetical protein JWP75_2704 [Frondihabitans sp.]|nr:hypothetical protein [Frondihabitans sp.]
MPPSAPRVSTARTAQATELPRRRRISRKRLVVLVSGVLGCAVIAAAGLGVAAAIRPAASVPTADETVFVVNKVAVPFAEFEIFLQQDRSETVDAYGPRVGSTSGATFWSTSVAGTTPTADLLKRARQDAITESIQFQLASKYKLVASPSFDAFHQTWLAENERRREALAAGKPIYGPQQYTEPNYLTYVTGDLAAELQQSLVKDGTITVTTPILRAYYESHLGDFTNSSQEGPVTDNFAALRKPIQARYVDSAYTKLISQLSGAAEVRTLGAIKRITESGCLAAGKC